MRIRLLYVVVLSTLAVVALAIGGCEEKPRPGPPPPRTVRDPEPRQEFRTEPSRSGRPPVYSYAETVQRVSSGVVTVRSEKRARPPRQHPFFNDPWIREFFGAAPTPPRVLRGLGSGVIVSEDGYILTNHHVVDGAEAIKIELGNQRILDARVIGTDPPSDLAVLKVDVSDLTSLPLGDSDQVQVGDVALAVGNPLGIGQTVTAGIISAKGRHTGLSDGSFEDFLQTDAPINQGNSGGALVNTAGELIGINSMILSPSGGNIGIGFAIPSNMARNVMEQLIGTGKVRRGHLGVAIEPVPAGVAQRLGLPPGQGVLVQSVMPDSPAARGGLRQGDVILEFAGRPVEDGNWLRNEVAGTPPGTRVTIAIVRAGDRQQLQVTLGEYPART